MDLVYLDNNATSPMLPEVWEAMRSYFLEHCGNPASSHRAGRQARQALEDARALLAHLLDALPEEVIFTSGATEANNLAVFGLCAAPPGRLLGSPVEHPSVAEPLHSLVSRGYELRHLPVTGTGVVTWDKDALGDNTRLLAVMLANHETGAIEPIAELSGQVGGKIPFHCDAAAAAGKIPISFRDLGVTSLTLSAHKFHGPKGIGVLLLKKGAKLRPQLLGGHQQQGKRPGTEPVPLAVGMATALKIALGRWEANRDHILILRELLLSRLRAQAAPVVLNGPVDGGLPHTLNLSFPGCRADVLLMNLDLAGVACATGSACSSGSLLPSPVLQAMGITGAILNSSLRFSLSPLLSTADIDKAALRIANIVNRLRQSSEVC